MSRPASLRAVLTLVSLSVLLSSCSRSNPTLIGVPTSSTSTTVASSSDVVVDGIAADLEIAIDELIESDSYRFDVTVTIATQDSTAVLELEGWVDGGDRELVLRSNSGEVTTRVTGGVATVERDGEIVEVPLESATTAPSLNILTAITDVAWAPGNIIQGGLGAAALVELGFDVNGPARVTIKLQGGSLARYTLTAENDAWSITANFFDVI